MGMVVILKLLIILMKGNEFYENILLSFDVAAIKLICGMQSVYSS